MLRRHTVSIKHALDGIFYSVTTQPNFRIHIFFTALAITLGYFLKLLRWEWVAVWMAIFIVWVAEMLNTAIESVVDLLTSQFHQAAKIAKDTSAGMVLIAAIGSLVIGALIYIPHLFLIMN